MLMLMLDEVLRDGSLNEFLKTPLGESLSENLPTQHHSIPFII